MGDSWIWANSKPNGGISNSLYNIIGASKNWATNTYSPTNIYMTECASGVYVVPATTTITFGIFVHASNTTANISAATFTATRIA
jgi:hypothetical protein